MGNPREHAPPARVLIAEEERNVARDPSSTLVAWEARWRLSWGRQVPIRVGPDMRALGDAQLIRIVLENLLRNAWKYPAKTASAETELGMLRQDGADVGFLRERGVGFDMAHASRLCRGRQRWIH